MELVDLAASFSLNKICRLCMGKDLNFVPLFEEDDNISEKVMTIVPMLKLGENDGLPGQICSSCLNQVNTSYSFKLQCESSDVTLRQLLDFQHGQLQNENSRDTLIKEESENIDNSSVAGDNDMDEDFESCCVKPETGPADQLNNSKGEPSSSEDHTTQKECNTRRIRNIPKKRKSLPDVKAAGHEVEKVSTGWVTYLPQENTSSKQKQTKIALVTSNKFKGATNKPHISSILDVGLTVDEEVLEGLNCLQQIQEDDKDYICQFCGKDFLARNSLHRHYKLHPNEKPFACEKCGEKFTVNISWKKHMRTHIEKAVCDICGQIFKSRTTLRQHLSVHNVDKSFTCHICGKTFTSRRSMKFHLNLHSKEKTHSCEECGACFKQKATLKNHMQVHSTDQNHVCMECGKAFGRKRSLHLHMLSHTGEKSNSCTFCNKSFTHKSTLRIHMRIHTGHRPYKCPKCDKTFTDPSGLRNHAPTHDDFKPHVCTECGKSFARKERMKIHLLTHSGERPYKCPHCGKGFVRTDNLQCHLKAMHGQETFK